MNSVDPFLNAVRRRLNIHRAYSLTLWTLGIGAVLLLALAASYLVRGEAVPLFWYPVSVAAMFVGGLIAVLVRRCSLSEASHFADDYFHLEDSVTSTRRFAMEGKEGGFYDLQRQATEAKLAETKPSAIRYSFPTKLAWTSAVLLLVAMSTAFVPPSASVIAQRALEQETKEKTSALNEGVKDLIEQLEKEITDPMERELLNADQLKKWADQLKSTKDVKEAMRQYANMERKLSQSSSRLSQRRDERMLAKAGEELRKDAENRQLGDKLKSQKYKDAAQKLKEMKVASKNKDQKEKFTEQQKRLKKLKSAAKRMASAARQSKGSKGKNSQSNDEGSESSASELGQMLETLEMSADDLDKLMKELEKLNNMNEQQRQQMQQQMSEMDLDLDGIGDKLLLLQAKKNLQGKLKMLGMKLGQTQGFMAGTMPSPFANPGGNDAGVGTDESRRNQRDELIDNGQYAQMQGIKGRGPSQTQVQSAAEGTGVSHRVAEDIEREFAKQMESFVQREDVPDDVKDGVREYFTNIHQTADESSTEQN